MNTDSILLTVKTHCNVSAEDTSFDAELIEDTNTILGILPQLGVGPDEGFAIEDDTDEWSDFLSENSKISMVKSYVGKRVRLLFDPPSNSQHLEALKTTISELESRLTY